MPILTKPYSAILEAGVTALVGINDQVDQNDYGASVEIALGVSDVTDEPVSGTPIVNSEDRKPPPSDDLSEATSDNVVGGDLIYWGGGPAYAWGDRYYFNHASSKSPRKAAFQNILFGDGHVSTENQWGGELENDQNGDNFSFKQGFQGGFYYWDGT